MGKKQYFVCCSDGKSEWLRAAKDIIEAYELASEYYPGWQFIDERTTIRFYDEDFVE